MTRMDASRSPLPRRGVVAVIIRERRLLVIRYAQTQFDNLFAPEQTSAPLATPGE